MGWPVHKGGPFIEQTRYRARSPGGPVHRVGHPTNFTTSTTVRLQHHVEYMLSYRKLSDYKIDYSETFGYLSFFVGRVTRPLRVSTPWGAELASCSTCGLPWAALPPRLVTFNCGFFEALLLIRLGNLDAFCASLSALTRAFSTF